MSKIIRRKPLFFLIVSLILVLTLLRENIFLELNSIILGENYNKAYFYVFDGLFKGFSVPVLKILKWALTGFFVFLITFLSVLGVDIYYGNRIFTIIFVKVYLFVFLFVIAIGVVGFTLNSYEDYYPVLRKLIGLIQSPIPFFMMFVVYHYLGKDSY